MKVEIVKNNQQLEDAYSVRKTVFVEEQNVSLEEEIDQYEQSSTHFVLYDTKNHPVGAGRFRVVDGLGKVERICVLAEVRKDGGGKLIMQAIEDFAKQEGIHTLILGAQTHAIGFYSNLGYEVVSEEFLDAGIPHKTMKKTTK